MRARGGRPRAALAATPQQGLPAGEECALRAASVGREIRTVHVMSDEATYGECCRLSKSDQWRMSMKRKSFLYSMRRFSNAFTTSPSSSITLDGWSICGRSDTRPASSRTVFR